MMNTAAHDAYVADIQRRALEESAHCPLCEWSVTPENWKAHFEIHHPGHTAPPFPVKETIRYIDRETGEIVDEPAEPDETPAALTKLDEARRTLAEMRDVDEVKAIRDKAEAMRVYAHQARLGLEAQNHAAEIKLRAERRAGQLLGEIERQQRGGDRKSISHDESLISAPKLSDIGISYSQSSRWQSIAALPESEFDKRIEAIKKADKEITTAAMLRFAEALKGAPDEVRYIVTTYDVDDPDTVAELKRMQKDGLDSFGEVYHTGFIQPGNEHEAVHISAGYKALKAALELKAKIHKQMAMDERRHRAAETPLPTGQYRCIVIDPPWPVQKIEREVRPKQGEHLDYPTMTLDEIAALPVGDLAYEDGCHLYLWTTQKYLPDAIDLVRKWGFNYQCVFTWDKPTGMTPYSWMYNTELVVFARRGDLSLLRNGLKLSFQAPSEGHSVKPDVFYNERVMLASPEPRLDMFARRPREGFTVWGDEV
jgi:N6-adenosine-specific RNA methylase IME4